MKYLFLNFITIFESSFIDTFLIQTNEILCQKKKLLIISILFSNMNTIKLKF